MADASAAWSVIQVGDLLRRADELVLDGIRALGPATHAGFPEHDSLLLDDGALELLERRLAALADVADQLRVLSGGLPDEPFELRYADVRDGAAEQLASGTADPARALLAARALTVGDGWRALAEALRATDAHADWGETTIAQLLRRFRGSDAALVRSALADAQLGDDATFADAGPQQLDALARTLDAYAAERSD